MIGITTGYLKLRPLPDMSDNIESQTQPDDLPRKAIDLSQYPIVPEPDRNRLTPDEVTTYRSEREAFIAWLHVEGKDPNAVEGYAPKTVQNTAYRTSTFYRFVWDQEGEFTVNVTHTHADSYLDMLAYSDASGTHPNQERKALLRLFRWLEVEQGLDPWEPQRSFSETTRVQPPDYLTLEERSTIRTAALEVGSIPGYNDLSPTARDRWRSYLAELHEKPISDVRPGDWDSIRGWKLPSLVMTSLDAGLRPHEVEHSRVGWVDLENELLRIPVDESAKTAENWHVALRTETTEALAEWLRQRACQPKYDDRDNIWLTREGNPYRSQSLRRLLQRLCERAGISTTDRRMSWYAIRHSVGTYMVRERGLAAAQAQLRHKRPETTMKYDAVPVEDRRDALDQME